MQALYRNGIDPTNVPLFLVFGRAGDSEEHLFSASQFSFDVMKTPSRGDASVRVYGSHKAVFVTCPGASLLAKHTENLKEPAAQNDFSPEGEKTNVSDDLDKTMNPDLLTGPTQEIKEIVVRAKSENRDLTEDEHKQIQNLIAQDKVRNTAAKGKPRPSLLKDNPEVERLTERLEHTCRLIIQERHPYCPINGILVTLPAAGTETDEEANQTGRICQRELNAAQDILQVNCPLFTLVCDMDGVPGFAAFVKRFTPDQRKQRVGSRFRMRPDPSLSAAEMESWAEKLAQHICHSVIPSFIYKFFRMERTGIDSMETVVKENVALYHLMRQMHERQKRLARILALGIAQETNGPALWGGCYIAGTGKDAETQAFAHGVFNRLVENQDYISWTKEASTQEWNYLRWTRLGYIGLAAYAAVLVLAIFLVRKLFS